MDDGDAASRPEVANGSSLAWRCLQCGRLHLLEEPSVAPLVCTSCHGEAFQVAAPSRWHELRHAPMRSSAGLVLGAALDDSD
jgi:hypothetical protein